jgi:serine protease AprX
MLRKFIGLCLLLAAFSGNLHATQYAFAVFFANKSGTPYTIGSPSAYLSSRAISRRSAQGISIDSTDLPVNPAYLDSIRVLTGGILYESSRWLNLCIVLLTDSAAIETLAGKPYIDSIKLVGQYGTPLVARIMRAHSDSVGLGTAGTSDTTYYGDTWQQTSLVGGNCLYEEGFNGAGKIIAVLDAGFIGVPSLPAFDSMRFDGRLIDTFNFVYDTTYVWGWDNHGTDVLSTMAAYVPNTYVGAAPRAMYALYVTEYDPDDQPVEMINMVCACERADSLGADVITESLGYDKFLDPADGLDTTQIDGKTTYADRAANMATKKGMLFVATAGNDGAPPIAGWGQHITTPGDANSALTVGAVSSSGAPASFSGYGPNAAGQVKPDVCALGDPADVVDPYFGYSTNTGTSFATPQIAGWAACLWQAFPDATPAQLRHAISASGSSYSTPGGQLGYGVPNFCQALTTLGVPKVLQTGVANVVTVSPNPFHNELNLQISPDHAGDVHMLLMNMKGEVVASAGIYCSSGINTRYNWQLPALPDEVYVLKVWSGQALQVVKVVRE